MHVYEFLEVVLQLIFRELLSVMRFVTQNGNVRTTSCLMCYRYASCMIQLMNLLIKPCISLIYAWKTNKCTNYSFDLLIITLPSSGSVPSAFWERLNWGTVDRILWMGVLCLVTTPQLRISQKALGTLPEGGNVMPKHVGATILN
jgi:hypothetical protein